MDALYFDNHTTTRPSARVLDAMDPFWRTHWGVPMAPHAMGQGLLPPLKRAYESLYALLGAHEADTFVFTSSGAEAINQVLNAANLDLARETGRNHFITSSVDEAPVIMGLERMEWLGCETTLAPVDGQGILQPETLAGLFTPRTSLVSLSWANGLTGVIQPVAEIAELCKERGIWLHLDATHVLGRIDFDLDEIAPDFISFNGEHLHAPKGTGGLWVRAGLRISPLILGGMDQDGWRAGSLPVPLMIGLGEAAQEALEQRDQMCMEVARLRDRLEVGLIEAIPGAQALFAESERLPTTACMAFPGVASDALLYALSRRGLYTSFGGGVFQQLSLQLEAMRFERPLADCAVTFSLSRETTEAEIDRAIALISEVALGLQELSTALFQEAS